MPATSSVFSLFLIQLMSNLAFASPAVLTKPARLPPQSETYSSQMIEETTRRYLLRQPEVVVEALQAHQKLQDAALSKTFKETQIEATRNSNEMFFREDAPLLGNPEGTITLVEFSDYQCSHCLAVASELDSLIHANANLRVVIKEFSIRGPLSEKAAKAALAAKKQNKYGEFRSALFKIEQPLTEAKIYAVAKLVKLDLDQLKKDMNSSAIKAEMERNKKMALHLKIMGTPVFFLAKTNVKTRTLNTEIKYIPGLIKAEELQTLINKTTATA